ncbi:S8 family serine peptidase [Nonomuraea angiospora]|uniref:S8 family serine peptidase n=1 Tax=Nonomuraea angiospora TaxID=46172 RepID=UPI00343EFCAB
MRTDQLAGFSSHGLRLGDHAIKPEITAPGVGITAAAVGGGYIARSGTSMATPHVAEAAAILAQRHPAWTGERLKAALIGSAAPPPAPRLSTRAAGGWTWSARWHSRSSPYRAPSGPPSPGAVRTAGRRPGP